VGSGSRTRTFGQRHAIRSGGATKGYLVMHFGSVLVTAVMLLAGPPDEPARVAPGSTESPAPITQPIGVVTGSVPSLSSVGYSTGPCGQDPVAPAPYRMVWGEIDIKVFPDANRMAPNGQPYNPIFSLDLNLNIWLWPAQGLYIFGDSRFWGQRGTPGQTHGNFDYTKREYDISAGLAWNYWGRLEFRGWGYAMNNLNRGNSLTIPFGYNDGCAFENRLYLSDEYDRLGQDGFNVSRATFVSLGYMPSKQIIGLDSELFKPGLFGRAYVTWDIPSTCCYLFADLELICDKQVRPRLFLPDVGVAIVPFEHLRNLEVRLGSEFVVDFRTTPLRNNNLPYLSVRLNY
jgi:hypothetical protein